MLNLLLATALAGQVALAHMTFFHPSMFAWNNWPDYPQDPMIDRAEEDWWFRGYPNSAPATGGEVFDLPAGQRVHTEITCHFYWTSWYGGYEETAYGAMDACPSADNSGPWHANLEPPAPEPPIEGVSGCALAIADVDDVSKVTRDNLAIFSVNSICVFQRDTYFEVPAEMPPCTNGKCICAWFWLANFGQANFYMTGFECNVSGSPKNARSIGAAQAPNEDGTWPNGNSGPRQPFYAYNDNPSVKYINNANRIGYHSGWGWKDGAQNDIFTGELAGSAASSSSAAASSAPASSAKASSKSSSVKTSTAAQTSTTVRAVPTTSSHATSTKVSSSSSSSARTSSSVKASSSAKTSSSSQSSSSVKATATSATQSSTSAHVTSSAIVTSQDEKKISPSPSSSTESAASSAVSPNNHAQNKVSLTSTSSSSSTKPPAKTSSSKVTSKAAKTTSSKAAQKVSPTTSSKASKKAAKTSSTKASSKAVKPTSSQASSSSSSSSSSSVAPTSTAAVAHDDQEEAETETVYRTVYRTRTVTVTASPTSHGRSGRGKRSTEDVQQQPIEYKVEVEEGADAEQGDLLARMAWGEAAHPGEALPGSWL